MGTVLVAEDTPELLAVATLYLRKLGYAVLAAEDGAQAVRRALEARPRAVLMDLEMPVMHGLEAVRRLRDAGFAAPILAMTAHTGERERAAALAAGCNGVMGKPVGQALLGAAIESALAAAATGRMAAKEETMTDNADWEVVVDRDLEDLVPVFLDARRADEDKIAAALASGDLDALRIIGHSMKGAGYAYGFKAVAGMGSLIEQAALAGDTETIRAQAEALREYMGRVKIRFS